MTACDFSACEPELTSSSLRGRSGLRIAGGVGGADRFGDVEGEGTGFRGAGELFATAWAVRSRRRGFEGELGVENHGFQGNNLAFLLNVFPAGGVGTGRLDARHRQLLLAGVSASEVYGILARPAPYAKHTHVKNINYPADQARGYARGGLGVRQVFLSARGRRYRHRQGGGNAGQGWV